MVKHWNAEFEMGLEIITEEPYSGQLIKVNILEMIKKNNKSVLAEDRMKLTKLTKSVAMKHVNNILIEHLYTIILCKPCKLDGCFICSQLNRNNIEKNILTYV